MNEVLRNLIREFESDGPLAPLVIEAMDSCAEQPDDTATPVVRLPFPAVYDSQRPFLSVIKFIATAPVFCWRLRSLCRRFSIEVLNPHYVGLEHLALVLFKRLGLFQGKLILSLHGSDLRTMIQSRGMERSLARVLLRSADALVPCSEGLGEEILMLAPECSDRITPVQNGIDVDRFVAETAAHFPLPGPFEHRRRILNIGAFEHKKGHDTLIRAFAQVRCTHPDTCLTIVGQTRGEFDATKELVSNLNLTNDVLLLQDLPHANVSALLAASHLFVLSSRWNRGFCGEGFAMVLLEAAAAGKPVVSTRSCGVAELIEDGETGLTVPPDNPELLAEAIVQLLNNTELANRQAQRLHARVAQEFTWKAAHRRYLRLASK